MKPDPFPPPNFKPVPSTISGIEVYAPAPEGRVTQPEIVEFACPQCGGTTAYSASSGGLTCAHCGYYQPPEQPAVGRSAEEREFTVETLVQSQPGWGEARRDLACENCGAVTSLPEGALTHTCPFCGSNKVIQRQAAPDALRPRFVLPFQIDANACQGITSRWLGSSWMTPPALKGIGSLAGFSGIYLPFWTFDARTQASWRAEVGHTVTETYHEQGKAKTRVKTVWRWETGQAQLDIDDLLIPGTTHVSRLLLDKLMPFSLSGLCAYEPAYLAGFSAQAFDLPLEKAWELGRQLMREDTRRACERQASSSQIRNFSMNLDFAEESWRYLLLPVYLATYRYADRTYQVMVNGQSGAIAGQRPVDWNRIWVVVGAMLAPGLLLIVAGLITLLLGGLGVVIGGFGLVLLLIAGIIAAVLLRQAYQMDDV